MRGGRRLIQWVSLVSGRRVKSDERQGQWHRWLSRRCSLSPTSSTADTGTLGGLSSHQGARGNLWRARLPGRLFIVTSGRPNGEISCYTKGGVTFVRVPTGYASSLDRNMPIAIRQRLSSDGYASTKAALEKIVAGQTIPA
jgi:hypothetical protein